MESKKQPVVIVLKRNRAGYIWTPEADRILLDHHKDGLTVPDISRLMGIVSVKVIAERLRALGKKPNAYDYSTKVKPKVERIDGLRIRMPDREPGELRTATEVLNILGSRLKREPFGFFLDGKPVGLDEAMLAANKENVARGIPQFVKNPKWRV